jgi:hypothetical protein
MSVRLEAALAPGLARALVRASVQERAQVPAQVQALAPVLVPRSVLARAWEPPSARRVIHSRRRCRRWRAPQ